MNNSTKRNCQDLIHVLRASPKLRMEILENCSKRIITTLVEVCLNITYGDITLTDSEKELIGKHRSACLLLTKNIKNLKRKRAVILNLDPLLLDLFADIMTRYV